MMYAIAVTSQVQLEKSEEAVTIFRDSVVPAYRGQNGFKSALLLMDPATGKTLGITLWESEADRSAVQTSGLLQEQLAKFSAVLAAPPAPSTYEVKVQV
jgi:heme-degrading monooxygenase HmoA